MPKHAPRDEYSVETAAATETRPMQAETELAEGILHVSIWFGHDVQYHFSGPMSDNVHGLTTILEAITAALSTHVSNQETAAEEEDQ